MTLVVPSRGSLKQESFFSLANVVKRLSGSRDPRISLSLNVYQAPILTVVVLLLFISPSLSVLPVRIGDLRFTSNVASARRKKQMNEPRKRPGESRNLDLEARTVSRCFSLFFLQLVSFFVRQPTSPTEVRYSKRNTFPLFLFQLRSHPLCAELPFKAFVSAGYRCQPINLNRRKGKQRRPGFTGIHRAPFNDYFNFIPSLHRGRCLNGTAAYCSPCRLIGVA